MRSAWEVAQSGALNGVLGIACDGVGFRYHVESSRKDVGRSWFADPVASEAMIGKRCDGKTNGPAVARGRCERRLYTCDLML